MDSEVLDADGLTGLVQFYMASRILQEVAVPLLQYPSCHRYPGRPAGPRSDA